MAGWRRIPINSALLQPSHKIYAGPCFAHAETLKKRELDQVEGLILLNFRLLGIPLLYPTYPSGCDESTCRKDISGETPCYDRKLIERRLVWHVLTLRFESPRDSGGGVFSAWSFTSTSLASATRIVLANQAPCSEESIAFLLQDRTLVGRKTRRATVLPAARSIAAWLNPKMPRNRLFLVGFAFGFPVP